MKMIVSLFCLLLIGCNDDCTTVAGRIVSKEITRQTRNHWDDEIFLLDYITKLEEKVKTYSYDDEFKNPIFCWINYYKKYGIPEIIKEKELKKKFEERN